MYGSSAPWGGIAQAPSGQRRTWGTSGRHTCSGQSFAAFCKRLSFLLLEAGLTQLSTPPLGKNTFSGLQQVPQTDDFCSVLSVTLDKTQAFVLFKNPLKTKKKKKKKKKHVGRDLRRPWDGYCGLASCPSDEPCKWPRGPAHEVTKLNVDWRRGSLS